MSKMIERVAAALWATGEFRPGTGDSDIDLKKSPGYEFCRKLAHAAIEAMWEPTEEMIHNAAQNAVPGSAVSDDPFYLVRVASNVWHAMVDEALK